MPAWPAPQGMKMGTTRNENYSPPREGCRGGLSRTGGPTPKANVFCPFQEGIFKGDSNE